MAYKEYTLNTNKFNRPEVLEGKDAIYTMLVRLALLKKGIIQTHPDMGLDLQKYRYSSDITGLKNEYKKQIATYLPALNLVEVNAKLQEHYLVMQVTIDNTIYPITIDLDTYTLEDFKN